MSAAIELFDEQGYEATTVAEIAERAGLTKRTFFRYFSDKREVLFSGSERAPAPLARGGGRRAGGREPARGRDGRARSGRGDVRRAPRLRPDPRRGSSRPTRSCRSAS